MEARARVAETVLTSGKLTEVLGGLGHDVVVEFEDDAACVAAADLNVELRAVTRASRIDERR